MLIGHFIFSLAVSITTYLTSCSLFTASLHVYWWHNLHPYRGRGRATWKRRWGWRGGIRWWGGVARSCGEGLCGVPERVSEPCVVTMSSCVCVWWVCVEVSALPHVPSLRLWVLPSVSAQVLVILNNNNHFRNPLEELNVQFRNLSYYSIISDSDTARIWLLKGSWRENSWISGFLKRQ